ncbi:hypothetical protein [Streptomyces sp. NPDC001678]|uniref:hypothetical protein n=1 Tax=Streptomyces sp. NPDC001678 TaxID=3364599 RepID=UPI0036AF05AD
MSAEYVSVVRQVFGPGRYLIMMGPSGSGKSTKAARLAVEPGAVVGSYDDHQRQVTPITAALSTLGAEGHAAVVRPPIGEAAET